MEPYQSRASTFSVFRDGSGNAVDLIPAAPAGYIAIITSWYFSTSTVEGGGALVDPDNDEVWGIDSGNLAQTRSGNYDPGLSIGTGPFTFLCNNTNYIISFTGFYVSPDGAG